MSVVDREWGTLRVSRVAAGVVELFLNRPDKSNALNDPLWDDIRDFFGAVATDGSVRVIVLAGEGKNFCSGMDFADFQPPTSGDVGHNCLRIRQIGKGWQDAFSNIEKCGKVVMACIHGACIGGGVELVSACDIRYCIEGTKFSLKEVDLGVASDVGGIQRFPKLVANQSLVRELVFSARIMDPAEALSLGFVSRVLSSREEMRKVAVELAEKIATKSPLALLSAKQFLNYSRDHTVDESLEYAITWNQGMLQSQETVSSAMALATKQAVKFDDLPAIRSISSKL